ncbi:hypothetical protein [Aquibacillus kalidii]|uniref:hypothetical protein n=1 Tax=Aquibacillus kalidii TaxID=2762597 RepID=UPI001C994601|nr:hypothetical protein [Aquibacillus kalidii]
MEALGHHFDVDKYPGFFPNIAEYTSNMEAVGFRVVFASHISIIHINSSNRE